MRLPAFFALALHFCAPGLSAQAQRSFEVGPGQQTAYVSADESLNRLQELFAPTLEANRKEFTGRTGTVKGFGAGSRYPQVWLRDSATLIPLSRYLYGRDHLRSWVEEHFAHQDDEGALLDWIAAGPASHFKEWAPRARDLAAGGPTLSGDKNTVEADQETSAVLALSQAFAITGDRAWLHKEVRGRPLIERAEKALQFLLQKRFHARLGLVTSGFSADWGDVSPVYPDQRAIYLDAATPLVAGLYTNALFCAAVSELAEVLAVVGESGRASYWREQAARARSRINAVLWQEHRGFYRMHVPAAAPAYGDDSHVFAMGGNAVAVLAGVADERQTARILGTAEERRKRFGVSTVAGVLLPPFPKGFFKHPTMAEEYSYQNGGQWDWFAGRLLLAAFERGHSRKAYQDLVAIAEKARTNRGLHEWHTREGKGRGSASHAGSAGALAGAVFQGLFGIHMTGERLDLKVRLGERAGQIHLYQPATDTYVSYRYRFDAAGPGISLEYQSNHPRPGRLALRLPPGYAAAALLLDGKKAAYRRESSSEDRYVALATDWAPHRLQLRLRRSR